MCPESQRRQVKDKAQTDDVISPTPKRPKSKTANKAAKTGARKDSPASTMSENVAEPRTKAKTAKARAATKQQRQQRRKQVSTANSDSDTEATPPSGHTAPIQFTGMPTANPKQQMQGLIASKTAHSDPVADGEIHTMEAGTEGTEGNAPVTGGQADKKDVTHAKQSEVTPRIQGVAERHPPKPTKSTTKQAHHSNDGSGFGHEDSQVKSTDTDSIQAHRSSRKPQRKISLRRKPSSTSAKGAGKAKTASVGILDDGCSNYGILDDGCSNYGGTINVDGMLLDGTTPSAILTMCNEDTDGHVDDDGNHSYSSAHSQHRDNNRVRQAPAGFQHRNNSNTKRRRVALPPSAAPHGNS